MYVIDEGQENKEILKRYKALLKECKSNIDQSDKILIRRAFHMAVTAHKGVRRKSGEPYVYHPIEVAHIAASEIGLGGTSIVCALLHDVVEDTDYTISDIKQMFNEKIAKIVDGLTKLSDIFDKNKSISIQAENYKKMLLTLSEDVRVILIKLADRLHNMRTLDALPLEKQLRVSYETTYLFAPLAHRLGLYNIKSEMEDLAFKYIEPEIYNDVMQKIEETGKERDKLIENFINSIKPSLDKIGVPYNIFHRLKSAKSIWDKMQKKQIPFEEVYDLFAIRIILSSKRLADEKSDCYQVLAALYELYKPNSDRFRDWLAIPKANGYESLHTTLMFKNEDTGKAAWIEVQIRTERMNQIAERGYAAHWKYKKGEKTYENSGIDRWLDRIRDILQDDRENALDFLDNIESTIKSEDIYVFTPKGELKSLPAGATVLDFAYSIHSDIGDQCISAKVNNKLVPINHPLKNLDQVEIINSGKQHPKPDWIGYVVTTRAKQSIKIALNEAKRKSASEGRTILARKFRTLSLSIENKTINRFIKFLNKKYGEKIFNNAQDVFIGTYNGKITTQDLREFARQIRNPLFIPGLRLGQKREKKKITELTPLREKTTDDSLVLFGNNMDRMDYTLANCCNPIPGDKIFGYINLTKKIVTVHRSNCPNAQNMLSKYAYRVIKARWSSNKEGQFLSGIQVSGLDKMGMVNNLTQVITKELNVNMQSISLESVKGLYEGYIMLYVADKRHLDKLIRKLERMDGINSVKRIERKVEDISIEKDNA